MKWPLKYQVMVPMTTVMLAVIVALSAAHAYWAAEQATREITDRIQEVTRTLSEPSFPLTGAVLEQMQGLAGADFVLLDRRGEVVASTRSEWTREALRHLTSAAGPTPLELAQPVRVGEEAFLHAAIEIAPRSPTARGPLLLHVLYAEQAYLRQRREAVMPSLAIGVVALAFVISLAVAIASRVTQPLAQLREQVRHIARGDFRPLVLPARDDEVRELATAVNHMAHTLAQYEDRIRHAEQQRTLAQLGGSLVHQLRNAVTGARIAIDLHRGECPQGPEDESLGVATRQLILMERYLKRFLTLGAAPPVALETLDFAQLVLDLVPLVQPAARHARAELEVDAGCEPMLVHGDRDALEHMTLNLLLNAVEAASTNRAASPASGAAVWVSVAARRADQVTLTVTDTGPGPPAALADRLCEPFVTGKKDGAGLGLAVAKAVAEKHRGELTWKRENERTTFTVDLPRVCKGNGRGDTAGD